MKAEEPEEHAEVTKRRALLQAQLAECGMKDELPEGTSKNIFLEIPFSTQFVADERPPKSRDRRWIPTCFFEPDSSKTIILDSEKRIDQATLPKIIEKVTTPDAGE